VRFVPAKTLEEVPGVALPRNGPPSDVQ